MFPELNNLLNTTPDQAEQVRDCTVGKGARPGSVAEDRTGSARGPVRNNATSGDPGAPGSCSPKRARPGLAWTFGLVGGGHLAPSQRSCVPLKVHRKHVQRLDWLKFADVYWASPLRVQCGGSYGAPKEAA